MQARPRPKTPVKFYRTAAGTEVVRDWLRGLDDDERNVIGLDLMRAQFRWPVGMPLCRSLGTGLWELRTNLAGNRIARLIFCAKPDGLLILSGFIKKTRKTPDAELALARRRMREFDAMETGDDD
jgi:phage-related protein